MGNTDRECELKYFHHTSKVDFDFSLTVNSDSFCLSLQLEVLHSQTVRLVRERLGESICVEQYILSKGLIISYWRDHARGRDRQDMIIYKLSVEVSEEDDSKPLQVSHTPAMTAEESRKVGLAIRSDHLSIEKLLMQTIEVRTHSKLEVSF